MGNNNNLNNNGSPGADIMFQMEDEGLTQLGSVFQSAYQSIVGGGPQVKDPTGAPIHRSDYSVDEGGGENLPKIHFHYLGVCLREGLELLKHRINNLLYLVHPHHLNLLFAFNKVIIVLYSFDKLVIV